MFVVRKGANSAQIAFMTVSGSVRGALSELRSVGGAPTLISRLFLDRYKL